MWSAGWQRDGTKQTLIPSTSFFKDKMPSPSTTGTESEEGSVSMADFGDSVDMAAFSQILEMDEDEEVREFSKPLVMNWLEQAEETFQKITEAIKEKDLIKLKELGHFLKGSSATLGFVKVKDSCQVIQQYGSKLTLDNAPEPDEDVCIQKIEEALKAAQKDVQDLQVSLKDFFGE